MVPIQNLYYLLCYAWNWLEAREILSVDASQADTPQDLLGRLLAEGVRTLIRRGLDRGYRDHREEGRTPRGKIEVEQTIKRSLMVHGFAAYLQDELSHDVLQN